MTAIVGSEPLQVEWASTHISTLVAIVPVVNLFRRFWVG